MCAPGAAPPESLAVPAVVETRARIRCLRARVVDAFGLLSREENRVGHRPDSIQGFAAVKLVPIIMALALCAVGLRSQEVVEKPRAFEVASIRPHIFNGSAAGCVGGSISGNRVTLRCLSLRNLIMRAYGVKVYQIMGGPSWLYEMVDGSYDISGLAEGSDPVTQKQLNQMLQSLLADRFQLRVHRETNEMGVYALVVGKNGPKMKESASDARGGISFRMGGMQGYMKATRESMAQLALFLSGDLQRPVIDKTGLSGTYEFTLEWTRDEPQMLPGMTMADARSIGPQPELRGPSIYTAIEEQLGLKLESQKAPIDMIVVDHAAKPSEN